MTKKKSVAVVIPKPNTIIDVVEDVVDTMTTLRQHAEAMISRLKEQIGRREEIIAEFNRFIDDLDNMEDKFERVADNELREG